jgi:hypothetical protein
MQSELNEIDIQIKGIIIKDNYMEKDMKDTVIQRFSLYFLYYFIILLNVDIAYLIYKIKFL